jgi:hypothetical protein
MRADRPSDRQAVRPSSHQASGRQASSRQIRIACHISSDKSDRARAGWKSDVICRWGTGRMVDREKALIGSDISKEPRGSGKRYLEGIGFTSQPAFIFVLTTPQTQNFDSDSDSVETPIESGKLTISGSSKPYESWKSTSLPPL